MYTLQDAGATRMLTPSVAALTQHRICQTRYHTGNVHWIGWDCSHVPCRGAAVAYLEPEPRQMAARELGNQHDHEYGMIANSRRDRKLCHPFMQPRAMSMQACRLNSL